MESVSLKGRGLTRIGGTAYSSRHAYSQVRSLDISDNLIDSLDGIESFEGIRSIDISNNRIAEVKELYRLPKRHTVTRIDINGNPIASRLDTMESLVVTF